MIFIPNIIAQSAFIPLSRNSFNKTKRTCFFIHSFVNDTLNLYYEVQIKSFYWKRTFFLKKKKKEL